MAYEASTGNTAAVKAPHGFTHPVLRMVPGDCVFAITTLYTRKLRQRGVKQLAKIDPRNFCSTERPGGHSREEVMGWVLCPVDIRKHLALGRLLGPAGRYPS